MTDDDVIAALVGQEPMSTIGAGTYLAVRTLDASGHVLDPDATLAEIDERTRSVGCFPTDAVMEPIDRLIFALKAWIDAGGRQPHWQRHPRGASEYRWRLTHSRH